MNWFKKSQDLYDLLLLEDLYYGNAGSFVTRVPGGWIFHHRDHAGRMTGVFVPFNKEFLNLSDENFQNMDGQDPDNVQGMHDQDISEEADTEA